jgi:hypothetical protein
MLNRFDGKERWISQKTQITQSLKQVTMDSTVIRTIIQNETNCAGWIVP